MARPGRNILLCLLWVWLGAEERCEACKGEGWQ